MRLDYSGSEFKENGAGYAVIRFYSGHTDNLEIPYSPAMGGDITNPEPFGGGGFTTSTLGYGGFPEFKFDGYYPPKEGAELYVATPAVRQYDITFGIYRRSMAYIRGGKRQYQLFATRTDNRLYITQNNRRISYTKERRYK